MYFWVVYNKSCLKVSYRATRGYVLIHSILFLSLKVLRHSRALPCRFAFAGAAWLNVIQHISKPWLHLLFKEKLSEVSCAPGDLAIEASCHWRARLTLPWFSQSPITDNSSTLRLIFHTQMMVMNQASLWTHLSGLSWLLHMFWSGWLHLHFYLDFSYWSVVFAWTFPPEAKEFCLHWETGPVHAYRWTRQPPRAAAQSGQDFFCPAPTEIYEEIMKFFFFNFQKTCLFIMLSCFYCVLLR